LQEAGSAFELKSSVAASIWTLECDFSSLSCESRKREEATQGLGRSSRLPDDEQVANLTEHATLEASAPDLLRDICPIHRTTDPALRVEASPKGGYVSEKHMIYIPMPSWEILLGLRS
jgi:hypothetical protein